MALSEALADPEVPPAAYSRRRPIDVEALLQWAIARSGFLPWGRVHPRDLTMNPYSARLRRRPKVGWLLAEIGVSGLTVNGRYLVPGMHVPGPDAARVLAAIQALDPAMAAIVIACARAKIRPNWLPGIVPTRIETWKNSRRKHRKVAVYLWVPCSPLALAETRAAYSRWLGALEDLHAALDGRLEDWTITGRLPPSEPWVEVVKKST